MSLLKKTTYLVFSFLLFSHFTKAQKKFEGKIFYEITYSDLNQPDLAPETQKAAFFYKMNQARFETDDKSSSVIYDYEKGDQLTLVDIPSLDYRQAVLSNIPRVDNYKLERLTEEINILGHKCNKVSFSMLIDNQEVKASGYADFDYKIIIGLDKSGNAIFSPLFFEQEKKLPDGIMVTQKITMLHEDFYDDKIFSLDYPEGFYFLDDRKNFANEKPMPYIRDQDWDYYNKLTTTELEEIVSTALPNEDFETATMINDIIDKRKKGKYYRSKSVQELQELISIALSKEEYDSAEEMKMEIINRSK